LVLEQVRDLKQSVIVGIFDRKMLEFEYICDDRLRASLMADYGEYQKAVSSEAWKAALVLSGSIVEALLVDHLLSTGSGASEQLSFALLRVGLF
jgi:hypothetical protein